MEDFVNMMSKNIHYITGKDGVAYQMRSLIYDTKFKHNEETTQVMAWIYFPDLLPAFFVKESILSLAVAVGNPYSSKYGHYQQNQTMFCEGQSLGRFGENTT